MPHFVVDCSENILQKRSPAEIMRAIFQVSLKTKLFKPEEIKVRINPFKYYSTEGTVGVEFIHVFANIMEGRNTKQKSQLSWVIIEELNIMFPGTPIISMNVSDFEKSTYCNKSMLETCVPVC